MKIALHDLFKIWFRYSGFLSNLQLKPIPIYIYEKHCIRRLMPFMFCRI